MDYRKLLEKEEAELVGHSALSRIRRHWRILRFLKDIHTAIQWKILRGVDKDVYHRRLSKCRVRGEIGNAKYTNMSLSELMGEGYIEETRERDSKGNVKFIWYSVTPEGEVYLREIQRILVAVHRILPKPDNR